MSTVRERYDKFKAKQDKKTKKRKLKRKVYKKQKCAFIHPDGTQCTRNAVGSGVLCKKHGGEIDSSALVPVDRTKEYLSLAKSSKFVPEKHPIQYIDYSRQGLSDVEIAAKFRVSVKTLRNWSETYEMFNTAFEIGQALHEAWWINRGKDSLDDRGFNTSLFKFLTSNKLGYSDKVESKSMNMNMHGVLVVPATLSEDAWAEKSKQVLSEQKAKEDAVDAEYQEVDKNDN